MFYSPKQTNKNTKQQQRFSSLPPYPHQKYTHNTPQATQVVGESFLGLDP